MLVAHTKQNGIKWVDRHGFEQLQGLRTKTEYPFVRGHFAKNGLRKKR
jgi:hypothetical protein